MIATLIKICLIVVLGIILYQDLKERQVWFFLFPLFALFGTLLFNMNVNNTLYLYAIAINLLTVGVLLMLLYILSRWVFKKRSLKDALGLGDVLFFFGFALCFPTFSFINFFAFSILFALVIHTLLKNWKSLKHATVPLAGWMSLFLMMVYIAHWTQLYDQLYLL